MKDLPKCVEKLFKFATPKERHFLKKVPSLDKISRDIENFQMVIGGGELTKRRTGIGEVYSEEGRVLGYHAFTIMNNANATPYERKYADMGSGMNYVQSKKLFVHPEHRTKGVGSKLIGNSLSLAERLGKHFIVDVEEENYSMINILAQHELQTDFTWSTPGGITMLRLYHD